MVKTIRANSEHESTALFLASARFLFLLHSKKIDFLRYEKFVVIFF